MIIPSDQPIDSKQWSGGQTLPAVEDRTMNYGGHFRPAVNIFKRLNIQARTNLSIFHLKCTCIWLGNE